MKTAGWIGIAALVGFLSGAYFFCPGICWSRDTAGSYAIPAEKIAVGDIGEYSIYNLIAQELGYFKENGLDVDIKEYSAGPPAVADLLANKVDFAVAADFVGVRNIFSTADLRIVAQMNKHYTFKVIARKDRGVGVPADLKGKRIGVTRQGVGEFFLGRFLNFNGIDLGDVRIADLQVPDMLDQFRKGAIDAAVIFNPHAYDLEKEFGVAAVSWSAQDEQRVFALLYSTNDFLAEHPATAERYVRALLEAEQFLKHNEQRSKDILIAAMHYDRAYVDAIWPNFDFTIGLDQSLFPAMEDQARFVIRNKLTDKTEVPNYLDYMYFPALEKTMPRRISVIR